LNMSKAYLSFIKGDFVGYLKSIIASFIMGKKKLWGKECFQKKKKLSPVKIMMLNKGHYMSLGLICLQNLLGFLSSLRN
jgi:hypothetical protein